MASITGHRQGTIRSAALNKLTRFPKLSKAAKSLLGSALPALPLRNGDHFIRLLRLDTARHGVVSCLVSVHALQDAPEFHALSYVWGDDQERYWITCNGHPVPVRSNLYEALLQLRRTEFTTLWIDAICIDQSDVAERNHQVQLMGKIYSSAAITVIWLGPAGPHDDRTVEYVKLLSRAWQNHQGSIKATENHCHLHGQDLVDLGLPAWIEHSEPFLEPVSDLFGLSWHNRAWVLQEFVLAKAVTLLKGQVRFDWEDVWDACFMLRRVSGWYAYYKSQLRYEDMALIRSEHLESTQGALEPILMHFDSQCANPRDKVFSILGIYERFDSQLFSNQAIQPNYEATTEDVYIEFVTYILRSRNCLDVLICLPFSNIVQRPLPSWVADFSIPDRAILVTKALHYGWSAATKPVVKVNGRALGLDGYVFDEIVAISESIADRSLLGPGDRPLEVSTAAVAELSSVLKSRRTTCPRAGSYVGGESRAKAFWRTAFLAGENHPAVAQACETDLWTSWESYIIGLAEPAQSSSAQSVHLEGPSQSFIGRAYMYKLDEVIDQWMLQDSLRMARTKRGYYCKVPKKTAVGDSVILCAGGKTPFVARRVDNDTPAEPRWLLWGGCYVHGIMYGEAWEPEKAEEMWFD